MSIKSNIATTTAGIARWGLRSVLHRSGGALPGKIGLAIDPELIAHLSHLLDASVVVTGTNGKTTTTNLIADAVASSGATCVCNRAGNNMETGITGALLEASSERKRTAGTRRVGVFECDELYTVRVLPRLRPTHFVLLNLFRDQLDRYGEIDHTQHAIAEALCSSPDTVLIFNADDPLCAAIAERVPNPKIPFGIDGSVGTETSHIAESRFCGICNAPLSYDYIQYGQLGSYRCPSCGWERPALLSRARNVRLEPSGYAFELELTPSDCCRSEAATSLRTKYNGLYMVYNITAAWTAAAAIGAIGKTSPLRFQKVLDAYIPTGGRMTRWHVSGREIATDLAKNPVGFDRQIQQIKTACGRLVAFYLNDAEADGRDVSWIWDVDFERLSNQDGLRAFVGGSRAHDLQVRLKYAGIDACIVESVTEVLASLHDVPASETLHVVANYTAFPPVIKELEGLSAEKGDGLLENHPAASTSHAPEHPASAEVAALERPLRIVHLYPDALNLYGDGGNAIVLDKRCAWRGIPHVVDNVHMGENPDFSTADIVLIGGGSDRDQLAVAHELQGIRDQLAAYIDDGGAMLAICGSYQLLGRFYYMGNERIDGLGLIDAETVRGEGRLTGNVAVSSELFPFPLVGFENHGGRTKLDPDETPLGSAVVPGTGNNGEDGFEGCLHKGLIGTYLHGPALSKNPELADWLLTQALKRRAAAGDGQAASLLPLIKLDDAPERAANDAALQLLG